MVKFLRYIIIHAYTCYRDKHALIVVNYCSEQQGIKQGWIDRGRDAAPPVPLSLACTSLMLILKGARFEVLSHLMSPKAFGSVDERQE